MTQVYCTYLRRFINDRRIKVFLESLLTDSEIYFDWQRMWILATLLASRQAADNTVKTGLKIFGAGQSHVALRAIAAIYVAKFGQFTRQKAVADQYANSASHYLQAALIYASRYFSRALRGTAKKQWSAHSELHKLVSIAVDAL